MLLACLGMMGNNFGIIKMFKERFINKFDILFSKNQLMNKFISEGMEKGEFEEAKENFQNVEDLWKEILSEEESDEEYEESDY